MLSTTATEEGGFMWYMSPLYPKGKEQKRELCLLGYEMICHGIVDDADVDCFSYIFLECLR